MASPIDQTMIEQSNHYRVSQLCQALAFWIAQGPRGVTGAGAPESLNRSRELRQGAGEDGVVAPRRIRPVGEKSCAKEATSG